MPAPARISQPGQTAEPDYPTLATAADGSAWAAWQVYENGGDRVLAAHSTASGWSAAEPLTPAGQELRLRQEYFFTSASLQDLVQRHMRQHNNDIRLLPDQAAIQLNDTHPAIAVAELCSSAPKATPRPTLSNAQSTKPTAAPAVRFASTARPEAAATPRPAAVTTAPYTAAPPPSRNAAASLALMTRTRRGSWVNVVSTVR